MTTVTKPQSIPKSIFNKDVIQSYIITSARYNFGVDEKRIMYRIVEMCQAQLEGKKLDTNFKIDKTLFGDCNIELPVSSFLPEDSNNHARIKKALLGLRDKTIIFEDEDEWRPVGIIEKPVFKKKGFVQFEIQPHIFEAILDFSKGFRKFELETAMSFNSAHTMRFYELFTGKTEAITYTIQNLKIMFKLEKKYDETKDFILRVIESSKKELDLKSPISFNYKKNKIGTKIVSLTFFPIKTSNINEPLELKRLEKQTSIGWTLDRSIINYLKENFLFDTDEIKHNRSVFQQADEEMDLLLFLSAKKRDSATKKNPKGWLIGAIKSELLKLAKEKQPQASQNTLF